MKRSWGKQSEINRVNPREWNELKKITPLVPLLNPPPWRVVFRWGRGWFSCQWNNAISLEIVECLCVSPNILHPLLLPLPPSLSLPLHASGVGRRGTRGRRGWLLSHQVDNNAPHPGNISCSLFCLRFYLDLCQSWHDMHSIIAHSSTLVVAILLTRLVDLKSMMDHLNELPSN